jgi:hypothetical protein
MTNIIIAAEKEVRRTYFNSRTDIETFGKYFPQFQKVQVRVYSLIDATETYTRLPTKSRGLANMPLKSDFEEIKQKIEAHGYIVEKTKEKEGRRVIVVYLVKKPTGRVVYSAMDFFDFYRWYIRNLATSFEKRDHQNCLMR